MLSCIFMCPACALWEGRSAAQAKAIRLDYGISGSAATLRVRRALLFNALKRLGLDTKPDARPPHVQQIVPIEPESISALPAHAAET